MLFIRFQEVYFSVCICSHTWTRNININWWSTLNIPQKVCCFPFFSLSFSRLRIDMNDCYFFFLSPVEWSDDDSRLITVLDNYDCDDIESMHLWYHFGMNRCSVIIWKSLMSIVLFAFCFSSIIEICLVSSIYGIFHGFDRLYVIGLTISFHVFLFSPSWRWIDTVISFYSFYSLLTFSNFELLSTLVFGIFRYRRQYVAIPIPCLCTCFFTYVLSLEESNLSTS